MIQKVYIMTQSQKILKTKKFKKIIENNDDVKMRYYIREILVSLNFLRAKLEGVATHYLRTTALRYHFNDSTSNIDKQEKLLFCHDYFLILEEMFNLDYLKQ